MYPTSMLLVIGYAGCRALDRFFGGVGGCRSCFGNSCCLTVAGPAALGVFVEVPRCEAEALLGRQAPGSLDRQIRCLSRRPVVVEQH